MVTYNIAELTHSLALRLRAHLRHRDEEGRKVGDYIAYTIKAVERGLELQLV